MITDAAVSAGVARQGMRVVESSIPAEMTIDEWRRQRPRAARSRRRRRRIHPHTPRALRHLWIVPNEPYEPTPLAA